MNAPRHLLALLVLLVACAKLGMARADEPLSFDRDIRGILSENCFQCHGPDSGNRQAGLRLDIRESAVAELESGARAIQPGEVASSELVARIRSTDPDTVMPPPEAKIGRLSAEQVAVLEKWIAAGAKYEPHWAFVAPRPPASTAAGPDLIDEIVAPQLAARGLALQPEADRRTLIRRASFDITGLPPTPAEVEAFCADTSPDAYQKLLDRLLASPRYGERMAADWLDLARYADSYGFQVDRERSMWQWRDWVISAFNRNLPWDQFTTWQVAGDLLPNATDEQILATGFSRLHQQECEGGSVEEEYRVNSVNDRVTTFGTAFLGLTLECCRCHDHKFDPLTQREFYQFFAFFDDVDEAGLYSFFTPSTPTPKLRLLDEASRTALARAEETCGEAAAALLLAQQQAQQRVAHWLAGAGEAPAEIVAGSGGIPNELVRYSFDERNAQSAFSSALDGDHPASSPAENILVPGHVGQAIELTGDHPVQTPVGNFRRSQPFSVGLWLKAPKRFERAVIFHRSQAWTDAASRGYELLVEEGHLQWSLIHFWPGDAASVRCLEPLPVGEWVHVAVTSDGSGTAAGLKIWVNGHPTATTIVRDNLTREITGGGGDHIRIGERMRDHGFQGGLVDDFRVFDRELSALELSELAHPGTLAETVASRTTASGELVGGWYAAALDAGSATARATLQAARLARDELAEKPEEIMVMRELAQPRTAYLLTRGEYAQRGEAVQPGTPAILPPFPADQPRNRLGLARWLTAPDHPLLARVTVNRLWQALFGTGLVKSPEDLGSQSLRPEYPALLDALAWRFSHSREQGGFGWDLKHLIKTIMLSKTYRQRSSAHEQVMADDPLNLWLARGPRHRLPAEMIRDGILAGSGLLVEQIGGPSVNTYDVAESFKPAKAGKGNDLYRRSLYTFWRRTGPAPVLESFDLPKRVVCVARRDTTNTPLHALVLLNGPQFVEAGRALAEKLLKERPAGAAPQVLLDEAFVRLTSRAPDATEREILQRMHAQQLAWYQTHPDEAEKLLAVGDFPRDTALDAREAAALAAVINALVNYDGCVVKR